MVDEFVYKKILEGALESGATSAAAERCALNGLEMYKQNRFQGKVSKLIQDKLKRRKNQNDQ